MGISCDIPNPIKSEGDSIQRKRRLPFTLLAFLLVLFHFALLMVHFEPAISTPDAQGYFAQAKLIAKQGKTYLEPESILQYIGPHWLYTAENRYFTTFPPGFPAILAVIYKIFGPKAALLVNPLMASLSLLGLFLLCRLWIGEGWALLAASLMAVNPFANEHAIFGDSHTAVIFFLIWALFFLARWIKTDSPWWAISTGLFVGIIPTIRYPEILFCIAFGIYVSFHLQHDKISWRSLLAGAIGAAIPIGVLCIRNQMAFGAFWRTGYDLSNEPAHFGWSYFTSYSLPYLQQLVFEGSGLIFVLGVIGIVFLCACSTTWKRGVLFAMLIVPITLLYMSYCWKPDPQSMRFLLPTFYIYTIAGVGLLKLIAKNHYRLVWAGSVVLLLVTVWWGLPRSLRSMQHLKNQNAVLAQVTSIVEKRIEPGSVVIANEGINQHLDFIGRWRLIDASILKSPRSKPPRLFAPNQRIPPQKLLRNIEARHKYADLTDKERFTTFSHDVWQWAGKRRKIFLIVPKEQINCFRVQLSQNDKLITIEKIGLPEGSTGNIDRHIGFRPPMGLIEESVVPQGQDLPRPNQIFDFLLNGKPLFLVEWTRTVSIDSLN